MFEPGMVALIVGDGPTAALIGTRLYPVQGVPDNPTFPYVTYQDITGSSDYAFDGAELRSARIQFDVWSDGNVDAATPGYGLNKSILNCLRNLLSGFVGTLNDGTRVLFTDRLNQMDQFDDDSRTYRSVAEYEFLISEV